MSFVTIVFAGLIVNSVSAASVDYNNTVYSLLEKMMSAHPPHVRPVHDHQTSTNLSVQIVIEQLIDVVSLPQFS